MFCRRMMMRSSHGAIGYARFLSSDSITATSPSAATTITGQPPFLNNKSKFMGQKNADVASLSQKRPYVHLEESRSYLLQPFQFFNDERKKIVYEITLEVDRDISKEYLDWMRSGHIQEALALPGFISWDICTMEGEGKTKGEGCKERVVFVERYEMASREALEDYFTKYSESLRNDHTRMWDGKFAASRRILEVFGQQDEEESKLWKAREERNQFRIRNLTEQLKQVPFFTSKGFHVQKTPTELWNKIYRFYREHGHKAPREQMNPIEVSINTWAVPTFKLDYPPDLTDQIIKTFKPILEQWSGIPDLESTGLSGIRTYKRGATIAEHVDLANTNVISALINIDQKVDELWPFQIRDHHGELHDMYMEPGDVIIYESATCAHRRGILKGDYYKNTFMRFKPRQWAMSEKGTWSL